MMRNISKIILASVFFLGLVLAPWKLAPKGPAASFTALSAYASGGGGHGAKNSGGGHGDAHGGHHAPPFMYYIDWAVLLVAWVAVYLYLKKRFSKNEHAEAHHAGHAAEAHGEHGAHGDDDDEGGGHHGIHVVQEAKQRSALLCGLVIFMFFVTGYNSDLQAYHEGVGVGLLKFAIKFSLGAFLTAFGILGMDEH